MAAVNTHSAILQYQGTEDGRLPGGMVGSKEGGQEETTASSHLDSFSVFLFLSVSLKRKKEKKYICTEERKRDCFTKKKNTHTFM